MAHSIESLNSSITTITDQLAVITTLLADDSHRFDQADKKREEFAKQLNQFQSDLRRHMEEEGKEIDSLKITKLDKILKATRYTLITLGFFFLGFWINSVSMTTQKLSYDINTLSNRVESVIEMSQTQINVLHELRQRVENKK